MPNLRATLEQIIRDFAASFAVALRDAVEAASLHDVMALGGKTLQPKSLPGNQAAPPRVPSVAAKVEKGGRLPRRTLTQINHALPEVVAIGLHDSDRFEGHIYYTLNRRTGDLRLSVEDEDVTISEREREALAKACVQ
jgi:hypothetical protein